VCPWFLFLAFFSKRGFANLARWDFDHGDTGWWNFSKNEVWPWYEHLQKAQKRSYLRVWISPFQIWDSGEKLKVLYLYQPYIFYIHKRLKTSLVTNACRHTDKYNTLIK
jgi:hypothetical protein